MREIGRFKRFDEAEDQAFKIDIYLYKLYNNYQYNMK